MSAVVVLDAGRYHGRVRHKPRTASRCGRAGRLKMARTKDTETMSAMPETLLQRIARADEASVRECVDRYGGLIWSLARRMIYSEAEAEDAVQDIFVEIWKNAGRYDPAIASETAFVAMIARRRLIDRRRRADRRPGAAPLNEDTPPPSEPPVDPAQLSEEASRAAVALASLSTEQQRVLRLSIYQGLSHEKISRSLSMPLGTVKTHARRGLMRIRELLGLPAMENGDVEGGASA